jgi:hypothetical protein
MAIILRSSKSIPLTFTEMDGNFSELNARATTLEGAHIKNVNGVTTSSAQGNAITLDSDNISEGSTNKYFTNANSRSAISVTDAGGDGSLAYNSSTGVITYTGPSAAEVRAHISATSATGVTYAAGTGVIALASIPNSSITNSTITVAGDSGSTAIDLGDTLTVNGTSGVDTAQSGNILTIGITADGVNDTHIDFGTGANQVNTADIPEQTNLYYTDVRADARIAAANLTDLNDVSYSSPTTNHVLTWTGSEWQPAEAPGATGGEANRAANVGGYNELFKNKSGVVLNFRTIDHGDNLSITQSTDTLTINTVAAPEFGNIKIGGNSIENIATNSNIALVPNGTGVVTIDSDLLPASDSSYDLGASGTEWANAYIDDVTATTVTATTLTATTLTAPTAIIDEVTISGNNISTNTSNANLVLLASGTGVVEVDSNIDMNSNKLVNVTDPVGAQDAATKAYVDARASSGATIFTIAGNSGANDTIAIQDTLTFEGTANQISTTISANKVAIGLPSNVTVGNNLTIGGDLTVTGTTITTGAANLSIADQYVYLNTGDAIGESGTNFTGSGLDDAVFHGYFEGTTTTNYYVRIDSTGTPDTFEWSKDNFSTTEATGVAITGAEQALDNNITIEFLATTGHTLNDVWDGTAAPIAQDAGFWANENNGTGKYGYTHVGIYYDQSDRTWKAVSNYTPEPAGNINVGAAGFEYAKFEAGEFISGSLVISGTEIKTTVSNQSLELAANGTGVIDLQSSTDVTGDVTLKAQSDLRFADADSSNWVAFQAPATVASNVTWTLPSADAATGGFALVSDAAGTLSFAAAGATVSADTSTNTNFLVYFADTTTGALTAVKQDSGLTYNPSTGTLTSAVFSGALSGNATSATSATNIGVANEGTDTTCFPLFATAASGNLPAKSNASLTFNSSNGTLAATTFSGALSGNVTGNVSGSSGSCTGNSATATLASTVTVTANNTANETVYLTFVDGATGTQGLETDTNLSYNPSTNVLSTTASAAQYADLAEIYAADAEYSPGTVVKVGGIAEITQADPDAQYLAGVISTAPAYLMNSAADGEAVALVGRVPVRVVGSINKGEAVFATHNGKASSNGTGPIVGIALESNSDLGEKLIECLLKV